MTSCEFQIPLINNSILHFLIANILTLIKDNEDLWACPDETRGNVTGWKGIGRLYQALGIATRTVLKYQKKTTPLNVKDEIQEMSKFPILEKIYFLSIKIMTQYISFQHSFNNILQSKWRTIEFIFLEHVC